MLKIPFARVTCNGDEIRNVSEVIKSGWLTTAGKTHEFEERFRDQVGARFACAVNSCTAALHEVFSGLRMMFLALKTLS